MPISVAFVKKTQETLIHFFWDCIKAFLVSVDLRGF